MVDDVVASVLLQDRVVARAVNGLVLIGGQYLALIFEGSHRSCFGDCILHSVGVSVAAS